MSQALPQAMPAHWWCPIGSLNLHTYDAERTECIWCGPNRLGFQPGRWVPVSDESGDYSAWSTWGPLTQEQMERST